MLQTLPVSSNSEVLIMFPEEFDMNSWIIEVSTIYRRKKLRSLTEILTRKVELWIFSLVSLVKEHQKTTFPVKISV